MLFKIREINQVRRRRTCILLISLGVLAVIISLVTTQTKALTPYEVGHETGQTLLHLLGGIWLFYTVYKTFIQL